MEFDDIDVDEAMEKIRSRLLFVKARLASIRTEQRLLAQEWPEMTDKQKSRQGHVIMAAREELRPAMEALEVLMAD